RISPDGKLVAFWKSTPGSVGVESTLHVVPISGGTPTQLAAELGVAEHPTWSPDGKRILFLGRPKRPALASARETTRVQPPDWWVVEVDGSGLKRTRSLPEG